MMQKSKKSRISIEYRHNITKIPSTDLNDAMKELGASALKLLLYYFSKPGWWEFRKEVICYELDIKERTLSNSKTELIEKGYLLIITGVIDQYFVGKTAVNSCKDNME